MVAIATSHLAKNKVSGDTVQYVTKYSTSELKVSIKLPRDLGMSDYVSTYFLAHHNFLEICIPNSLVVWPVSTANHFSQHACKILRHAYTLEEHVLWLAEDSADIRHHVQIEHIHFLICSLVPIPQFLLTKWPQQGWSGIFRPVPWLAIPNISGQPDHYLVTCLLKIMRKPRM